jgi:hypothetical protein
MVRSVREDRQRIANKMAAQGTLNSGGFVTTVGGAFRAGFAEFTKGITADGLTVVRESFGENVTPDVVMPCGKNSKPTSIKPLRPSVARSASWAR